MRAAVVAAWVLPLVVLSCLPATAQEPGVEVTDLIGASPGVVLGNSIVGSIEASVAGPPRLPGLSLDLEACLNGGCVRASEGTPASPAVVVLGRRDAGPVRVRLHLDCAQLAELRGIASLTRVVLVRAGERTLHCPRVPQDAYCEFRFWQWETRWDEEIVAEFFPRMAETAWPDPEGRVDESELTLELDADLPAGSYDLVAALPKELVDQYPCEEVRNHQWVESLPLRVEVVDDDARVRWQTAIVALRAASKDGDEAAVAFALDDLIGVARDAAPGVLPMSAEAVEAVAAAAKAHPGADALDVLLGRAKDSRPAP